MLLSNLTSRAAREADFETGNVLWKASSIHHCRRVCDRALCANSARAQASSRDWNSAALPPPRRFTVSCSGDRRRARHKLYQGSCRTTAGIVLLDEASLFSTASAVARPASVAACAREEDVLTRCFYYASAGANELDST